MVSGDFSNKTIYGVKSDAARHFWAGYFIFVLVSSFVGDTIILIASIRYKAFKLQKLIVVIIQHIAVCDLIVTCVSAFTRIVTLIADDWILGTPLCHIVPTVAYYSVPVGVLLIWAMTTCKLLLLMYPLRVQSLGKRHAHMVCAAMWLSAVSVPVMILLIDPNDVKFSFKVYLCDYFFSAPQWILLTPIISAIVFFIPNALVVFNTIAILIVAHKFARRGRESLKWQGVITTVLVALVYCISLLPYSIHRFAESSVDERHGWFHHEFARIGYFSLYINTISNFYIYCLTVASFRKFLWSRIHRMLPCMSKRRNGASTQNTIDIPTTSRQR